MDIFSGGRHLELRLRTAKLCAGVFAALNAIMTYTLDKWWSRRRPPFIQQMLRSTNDDPTDKLRMAFIAGEKYERMSDTIKSLGQLSRDVNAQVAILQTRTVVETNKNVQNLTNAYNSIYNLMLANPQINPRSGNLRDLSLSPSFSRMPADQDLPSEL